MFKDPITTFASDNSLLKVIANIPSLQTYKLYAQDKNNQDFPTFENLLKNTQSTLEPEWCVTSIYEDSKCETKIHFMNTYSYLKPTFIFQHGLLITNHKANLDAIISKSFYKEFNVVSIQAAWHTNPVTVVKEALASFNKTILMLVSSVHAIESVSLFHKKMSTKPLIVCGTSMGGITCANHYFYYNSADLYFPIVAYPNFAKLIFAPKYASFFYDFTSMANNNSYLSCMDVPTKINEHATKNKVFPILAKLDEAVPYSDAKAFWQNFQTLDFDCGHFEIVKYAKNIRQYILDRTHESH
ncbi:MAG: hypothetical protein RLY61_163 [Candidatus Parcubacteria bacterium]|jgi:hypothetical protein